MKGKHLNVAQVKQAALKHKILCVIMALALVMLMIPGGLRAQALNESANDNAQQSEEQAITPTDSDEGGEQSAENSDEGAPVVNDENTDNSQEYAATESSDDEAHPNFDNFNITWKTDGEGSISGECRDDYGYFTDHNYSFTQQTNKVDDFVEIVKADPDVDDPIWDDAEACSYSVNKDGELQLFWGDWNYYLIDEAITPAEVKDKTPVWYVNDTKIEDTDAHALSDIAYTFTVKYEGEEPTTEFGVTIQGADDSVKFDVEAFEENSYDYLPGAEGESAWDDTNIESYVAEYTEDYFNWDDGCYFKVSQNSDGVNCLYYYYSDLYGYDFSVINTVTPNNTQDTAVWKYCVDGGEWTPIGADPVAFETCKHYTFQLSYEVDLNFAVNVSSDTDFDIQDYGAVETYTNLQNFDDPYISLLEEWKDTVNWDTANFYVDNYNELYIYWESANAGEALKGDFRVYPSQKPEVAQEWQYQVGDGEWKTLEIGQSVKFTNDNYQFKMVIPTLPDFQVNASADESSFDVDYVCQGTWSEDLSAEGLTSFKDTNVTNKDLCPWDFDNSYYHVENDGSLAYMVTNKEGLETNYVWLTPASIAGKAPVWYLNDSEDPIPTDGDYFTDITHNFKLVYEDAPLPVDHFNVHISTDPEKTDAAFDVDGQDIWGAYDSVWERSATNFVDPYLNDLTVDMAGTENTVSVDNENVLHYSYLGTDTAGNTPYMIYDVTPHRVFGFVPVWTVDGKVLAAGDSLTFTEQKPYEIQLSYQQETEMYNVMFNMKDGDIELTRDPDPASGWSRFFGTNIYMKLFPKNSTPSEIITDYFDYCETPVYNASRFAEYYAFYQWNHDDFEKLTKDEWFDAEYQCHMTGDVKAGVDPETAVTGKFRHCVENDTGTIYDSGLASKSEDPKFSGYYLDDKAQLRVNEDGTVEYQYTSYDATGQSDFIGTITPDKASAYKFDGWTLNGQKLEPFSVWKPMLDFIDDAHISQYPEWNFQASYVENPDWTLSGRISKQYGSIISGANVSLSQNGTIVAQTQSDNFGDYELNISKEFTDGIISVEAPDGQGVIKQYADISNPEKKDTRKDFTLAQGKESTIFVDDTSSPNKIKVQVLYDGKTVNDEEARSIRETFVLNKTFYEVNGHDLEISYMQEDTANAEHEIKYVYTPEPSFEHGFVFHNWTANGTEITPGELTPVAASTAFVAHFDVVTYANINLSGTEGHKSFSGVIKEEGHEEAFDEKSLSYEDVERDTKFVVDSEGKISAVYSDPYSNSSWTAEINANALDNYSYVKYQLNGTDLAPGEYTIAQFVEPSGTLNVVASYAQQPQPDPKPVPTPGPDTPSDQMNNAQTGDNMYNAIISLIILSCAVAIYRIYRKSYYKN